MDKAKGESKGVMIILNQETISNFSGLDDRTGLTFLVSESEGASHVSQQTARANVVLAFAELAQRVRLAFSLASGCV